MPPEPELDKSLNDVIAELAIYPPQAFEFVQQGLSYTVSLIHGQIADPSANRHVSGPQLCQGLREYGFRQWGLMAGAVLRRWNITSTMDFGRIVFAMVE